MGAGPDPRARGARSRTSELEGVRHERDRLQRVCLLALYLTLRTQSLQPFARPGLHSPPWSLAFNIAASFVSNTAWQYYGGESTLSTLSQMAGITVHAFLSGAVGLAVAIAVTRGFTARSGTQLGNFWADLISGLFYVLLPLAVLTSLLLVAQGAVQTLTGAVHLATLTGGHQTLALGPVASEKAINLLSSDGGGFYAVSSAMPFEDPTGLSNFLQALMVLLIPAALTATYGRMAGSRRQGWTLYCVMAVMLLGAMAVAYPAESRPSPAMRAGERPRRQHGGQGTTLRGVRLDAPRRRRNRFGRRRDERGARLVLRPRRLDPDGRTS